MKYAILETNQASYAKAKCNHYLNL